MIKTNRNWSESSNIGQFTKQLTAKLVKIHRNPPKNWSNSIINGQNQPKLVRIVQHWSIYRTTDCKIGRNPPKITEIYRKTGPKPTRKCKIDVPFEGVVSVEELKLFGIGQFQFGVVEDDESGRHSRAAEQDDPDVA